MNDILSESNGGKESHRSHQLSKLVPCAMTTSLKMLTHSERCLRHDRDLPRQTRGRALCRSLFQGNADLIRAIAAGSGTH